MLRTYDREPDAVRPILDPEDVQQLAHLAESVYVAEELRQYMVRVVRYSRSHKHVLLGNSPRAAIALSRSAKARALLNGRDYVLPDDVRALAKVVLAHRVILTPDAELNGVRGRHIVQSAIRDVPNDSA